MIEKQTAAMPAQAQVYTDLSGLQQLKTQALTDKGAALKNVAHQFESMMVQMMMKSMREANEAFADGDMTSSNEEKMYQDMFDSQLSLTLSQGKGFGIADALARQLQSRFDPNAAKTTVKPMDHSVAALQRRQVSMALGATSAEDNEAVDAPDSVPTVIESLFTGDGSVDADAHTSEEAAAQTAHFDGSPAAFVKALKPVAERVAKQLGVDSRVLISQSALETGWGQKVLQRANGQSSYNFFNIKADANWHGPVVNVQTVEYHNGIAVRENAPFRAYASAAESFTDYAQLIANNPRYQSAIANADDPRAYVNALSEAGYATDPDYTAKVMAVLNTDEVQQAAPKAL